MAKLLTFVMFGFGLMFLFYVAGLQTSTSWALKSIGIGANNVSLSEATLETSNNSPISQSPFFILISAAILGLIGVGAGIKLGFINWDVTPTAITAVAGAGLALLLSDFVSIVVWSFKSGSLWSSWIIMGIMLPMIVGYALSLYDWIRSGGQD